MPKGLWAITLFQMVLVLNKRFLLQEHSPQQYTLLFIHDRRIDLSLLKMSLECDPLTSYMHHHWGHFRQWKEDKKYATQIIHGKQYTLGMITTCTAPWDVQVLRQDSKLWGHSYIGYTRGICYTLEEYSFGQITSI
jgi:hypothetical protein